MKSLKKIFIGSLAIATLVLAYFSAYLPYAKSRAYIGAVRQASRVGSLDEFKKIFDAVFNFYSPVGDEEVVKFLSTDILNLLGQPQAEANAARILVEYIEPRFFEENVRHMITAARMYETLWRQWGGEGDYEKAVLYYLKAYKIGPKLPPVLYGMASLYYAHRDFENTKKIAEEILRYWPEDGRVIALLQTMGAAPQ